MARVAGFVPVLFVAAIIVMAYLTAVPATLIPMRMSHPWRAGFLLFVFHFIYINVCANYFLLVFADPGGVPDDWRAPSPRPHPAAASTPGAPATSTALGTESTISSASEASAAHPSSACKSASSISQSSPCSLDHMESDGFQDDSDDDEQQLLTLRRADHQAPSAGEESPNSSPFRYFYLMEDRTFLGSYRYCRHCKHYKPDRAHHCSVCGRCILKMDHHCVFINNCVSFFNHKFFVCFVTYAFLGCFFVSVVSFSTFLTIITESPSSRSIIAESPSGAGRLLNAYAVLSRAVALSPTRTSSPASVLTVPDYMKTIAVIGYIMSSAFAFALAFFVGFHIYLIAKGRTTIEMYELTDPQRAARVARYNLGISQNFKNTCGTSPACWFFPTRAFIPGDGIRFDRQPAYEYRASSV